MRLWPTWRVCKRWAIGLAILVAIALIANGFMAWQTERRLQAKIAAIRAAGDPASIADLAPAPIPDSENAAAILERIGPRLNAFSKEYGQFYDSPLGKQYDETRKRGAPATSEQIDAIRAILDNYRDIDSGLAAAAARKDYKSIADFSLDYNEFLDELLNNRIVKFRTAARFINWRMEVLIADGQRERAAKLGIEVLQLARLCDKEPTVVSILVAIAVRGIAANSLYDVLAAGTVSPELHEVLEQELAKHEDPQRMVRALKSERALVSDGFKAIPSVGPQPPEWIRPMLGWTVTRNWIGVLDFCDAQIALVDGPDAESHKILMRQISPQGPSGYGTLADLLIPATQATYNADLRIRAVLRALRIYIALRQFAEKNGREATGLEELSLPEEATIDPYSGEPLLLKHTEEGWVIYSVMENGVDDGGDFKGMKDYGVGPPKMRLTE
jgi:hypothetical protein